MRLQATGGTGKDALLNAGFAEADLDGNWTPYKPVGCENCKGSGYKGRLGIYQVMPITETMQDMILQERLVARDQPRGGATTACATCASPAC